MKKKAGGLADNLFNSPMVYPSPREIELRKGFFEIGDEDGVVIGAPTEASEEDLKLARFWAAEVSDRHGIGLGTLRMDRLPEKGRRAILLGAMSNRLVRDACERLGLVEAVRGTGAEGYVLDVTRDLALVAGYDEAGAFRGLQSLRQLLSGGPVVGRRGRQAPQALIRCARARDWPHLPFRGVRLYLPGRESIAFFKRFLRDFMALYKFNKIVIEVNAAMRLDRHPELNAGWLEFAKEMNYTRRLRPAGPGGQFQDSAHHDTGDFGVIEKEEVADLVRYARDLHIEVIPEIPSLTHAYYLLTRRRDLAEIAAAEWPDTYCPLAPGTYDLLFDVMDEYIEVMRPKTVHIGHDEWRMPADVCPRCKDRDYRELLIEDIRRIHGHLAAKGIRTAMWGDHFIESVRGKGLQPKTTSEGYSYRLPGALTPEQVKDRIPKDILVFNWFWDENGKGGRGEANDVKLEEWGFEQVYGNMAPALGGQNYGRRTARRGVLGGAPSSWAASREFNFGKDMVYPFLGCAQLLWGVDWPPEDRLSQVVQSLMPVVRRNLSGKTAPSQDGDPVEPIDLSKSVSLLAGDGRFGFDPAQLCAGEVSVGEGRFVLPGGKSRATSARGVLSVVVKKTALSPGAGAEAISTTPPAIHDPRSTIHDPRFTIPSLNADVSSLLFLHACEFPAGNARAFFSIYNFADSADLLGWYEVAYEDGLIETIPLRYGVNICEWQWARGHDPACLCYEADPVECGIGGGGDGGSGRGSADGSGRAKSVTLWAYEWTNPRFGKTIKGIRLRGAAGFHPAQMPKEARGARGIPEKDNAVYWAALSAVKARPVRRVDKTGQDREPDE